MYSGSEFKIQATDGLNVTKKPDLLAFKIIKVKPKVVLLFWLNCMAIVFKILDEDVSYFFWIYL